MFGHFFQIVVESCSGCSIEFSIVRTRSFTLVDTVLGQIQAHRERGRSSDTPMSFFLTSRVIKTTPSRAIQRIRS